MAHLAEHRAPGLRVPFVAVAARSPGSRLVREPEAGRVSRERGMTLRARPVPLEVALRTPATGVVPYVQGRLARVAGRHERVAMRHPDAVTGVARLLRRVTSVASRIRHECSRDRRFGLLPRSSGERRVALVTQSAPGRSGGAVVTSQTGVHAALQPYEHPAFEAVAVDALGSCRERLSMRGLEAAGLVDIQAIDLLAVTVPALIGSDRTAMRSRVVGLSPPRNEMLEPL